MHELCLYFNALKCGFGESAMAVLLLQILLSIYPPLASAGAELSAPLGVVVCNEEHLRKVVRALTIFGTPRIISMLKTPKEFKKSISEGNYPFKLFQFARGRYTDGNMEELLAKYDEVGTNYVPEIYVIFFIGGIPPKYADSCAGVVFLHDGSERQIPSPSDAESIMGSIICFLIRRQEYFENKSYGMGEMLMLPDMYAICSAAYLLQQFVDDYGGDKDEQDFFAHKINEALDQFSREWYGSEDPMVYVEAFRKQTISALSDLSVSVCNRLEVGADILDRVETTVFYDDMNYYMPRDIFDGICNPICSSISLDYLKAELSEAGLLVVEEGKRKYYTKETELVTVYGAIIRKRLVKLRRKLFDRDGEPTILDLLDTEGVDGSGSETWTDSGNTQIFKYCG